MDVGDNGVGVRDIMANVGNDHMGVDRKFRLGPVS